MKYCCLICWGSSRMFTGSRLEGCTQMEWGAQAAGPCWTDPTVHTSYYSHHCTRSTSLSSTSWNSTSLFWSKRFTDTTSSPRQEITTSINVWRNLRALTWPRVVDKTSYKARDLPNQTMRKWQRRKLTNRHRLIRITVWRINNKMTISFKWIGSCSRCSGCGSVMAVAVDRIKGTDSSHRSRRLSKRRREMGTICWGLCRGFWVRLLRWLIWGGTPTNWSCCAATTSLS